MANIESNIKSKLIDRIKSIQDMDVLDELNRLLEVDVDDTVYIVSKEQRDEISTAKFQLNNHQGIPNDQVNSEIEKWLSK
ncbi:MAG: hypothetical protein RIC03_02960 [Cyclobacteriaceae bacterium]